MAIRLKDEEVARLMVLRGLKTKKALAESMGMTPQQLGEVLSPGYDMRFSTFSRICIALGCQPGELLEESETLPV